MKISKRLAQLFAVTSAVAGLTAACGGTDDQVDDNGNGGAGGADAPATPTGPQCDEPGGSQCTGSASGLVCPTGSTNAVEFTCATGEECKDGECVGQCEAGATECVADSVARVCAADGRSWVNVQCQEGETCVDGACGLKGGLVCVPGTRECVDGENSRSCKPDGSGWDEVECPGDTACSDGACRGTVCEVGATRCDETTLDIPSAIVTSGVFESGGQPNFGVVYRCVDGESWEIEPCASDEDAERACAYTGVSAATVSKYRADVNSWFAAFLTAMNNDGTPPPAPVPPALPAGAKAECVEVACDWEATVFEGPAGARYCGSDSEEEPSYLSFTQCDGFLPYSGTKLTNYECPTGTACGYQQRGCYPTNCYPNERECNGDTAYGTCSFNYDYPSSSNFQGATSCQGETPSACANVGSAPERDVTCGGEAPIEVSEVL